MTTKKESPSRRTSIIEGRESMTKRNRFRRYNSAPEIVGCHDVDINKLKLSSLGLHGRDSEKAELLEACHRVSAKSKIERRQSSSLEPKIEQDVLRSPELVLISGTSGTGKSALAQSIKNNVEDAGCFFVSGKFSMRDRAEPYTAFLSAFNSLCDQILSSIESGDGSPDRASALILQSAIRDAISSESSVLTGIIPKLSLILDTQEGASSNSTQAIVDESFVLSRNKLNFLLRQFIHSCCGLKTIVMFLDDIQWADTASLELLKVLISDRHNPNLLIICSFRDTEDGEKQERNHPLVNFLDESRVSKTTTITTIRLNNLDIGSTNNIISHALTMTPEKTHPLARIVHKKTHGNPFAIIHFLKTMQEEGFLQYCLGTLGWKWEEDKIQICISATDNVVELLIYKIRKKLPLDVRKVLQIAACLGGTFDVLTISLVSEKIQDLAVSGKMQQDLFSSDDVVDVDYCLDICVDEGLLETDGNLEYCFVHDQVLTACFSLIPDDCRDLIQYQIGEALMDNLPASELEKNIFVIVGLLNDGIGLILNDEKKRIQVSRLNLQAATKAMKVSAYESGGIYVKTGIHLLGTNLWAEQKSLALALYTTGAKIAYCDGNLVMLKTYLEEVFEQSLTVEEKAEAYSTQIFNLTFLQDKCGDACSLALEVLAKMGVHISRKLSKQTLIQSFLKTKWLLKGFDEEKLCDLSVMVDKPGLFTMQLLSQVQEIAFLSIPKLFPLIAMKAVQMSIREGISKFSSIAFAGYGIFLAGMGSMNEAKIYANAAIALVRKFEAKDIEPKVLICCYNFILFREKPFFLLHKLQLKAYEMGLQVGDVNFAFIHLRCAFWSALIAGKPLPVLESQVKEAFVEMEDYNQRNNIGCLRPFWQFLMNMMGRSSNPLALTGEAVHQEEYDKLNRANINSSVPTLLLKTLEYWAAFYFEDFDLVLTLQKQFHSIDKARQSLPIFLRTTLFEGLTAFSLARTKKSKRWKKQASKITSKVQAWVDSGDINFKHILLVLEAEMAALTKNHEKAHEKYNRAIAICSKYGFNHDRALANERFGEYLLEYGEKQLAKHHIILARQSYLRWGAKAKANHIRKKYAILLDGVDFEKLDKEDRRWSI